MNAIKVATMFSDKGVYFKQDEDKKIAFLIDTAHLTPAKYRVDIVAYVTDKFGEDHFLDGVYPGFFFEITDRINEHNSKVWHQQYWGAIHLQDAKILNE